MSRVREFMPYSLRVRLRSRFADAGRCAATATGSSQQRAHHREAECLQRVPSHQRPYIGAIGIYTTFHLDLATPSLHMPAVAQEPPPSHPERWAANMTKGNFTGAYFRESSQWKMLTRAHAQVIDDDTIVLDRFLYRCPLKSRWALASKMQTTSQPVEHYSCVDYVKQLSCRKPSDLQATNRQSHYQA